MYGEDVEALLHLFYVNSVMCSYQVGPPRMCSCKIMSNVHVSNQLGIKCMFKMFEKLEYIMSKMWVKWKDAHAQFGVSHNFRLFFSSILFKFSWETMKNRKIEEAKHLFRSEYVYIWNPCSLLLAQQKFVPKIKRQKQEYWSILHKAV